MIPIFSCPRTRSSSRMQTKQKEVDLSINMERTRKERGCSELSGFVLDANNLHDKPKLTVPGLTIHTY